MTYVDHVLNDLRVRYVDSVRKGEGESTKIIQVIELLEYLYPETKKLITSFGEVNERERNRVY